MIFVAAIVLPLTFTAPASVNPIDHYVARRGSAEQGWVPANVYGSAALGAQRPKPAGQHDSLWVVVTTDPAAAFGANRGGQLLEVAGVTALGDSAKWSNPVAIAAGCRDTNWTDTRTFQRPTSGVVRFARPVGDDALDVGPVLSQEALQLLGRDVLCSVYGYWCRAGQRETCGLVAP